MLLACHGTEPPTCFTLVLTMCGAPHAYRGPCGVLLRNARSSNPCTARAPQRAGPHLLGPGVGDGLRVGERGLCRARPRPGLGPEPGRAVHERARGLGARRLRRRLQGGPGERLRPGALRQRRGCRRQAPVACSTQRRQISTCTAAPVNFPPRRFWVCPEHMAGSSCNMAAWPGSGRRGKVGVIRCLSPWLTGRGGGCCCRWRCCCGALLCAGRACQGAAAGSCCHAPSCAERRGVWRAAAREPASSSSLVAASYSSVDSSEDRAESGACCT